MNTYSNLLAAVQDWMHRADLSGSAAQFISLAEAKLNRELAAQLQESTKTVTLSAGSLTSDLPPRAAEVRWLSHADTNETIELVPQSDLITPLDPGRPLRANVSDAILFERPADVDYTINCRIIEKLDLASDNTNWLLASNPDLYFYGALSEAALYTHNAALVELSKRLYAEALDSTKWAASRQRRNREFGIDPAFLHSN